MDLIWIGISMDDTSSGLNHMDAVVEAGKEIDTTRAMLLEDLVRNRGMNEPDAREEIDQLLASIEDWLFSLLPGDPPWKKGDLRGTSRDVSDIGDIIVVFEKYELGTFHRFVSDCTM